MDYNKTNDQHRHQSEQSPGESLISNMIMFGDFKSALPSAELHPHSTNNTLNDLANQNTPNEIICPPLVLDPEVCIPRPYDQSPLPNQSKHPDIDDLCGPLKPLFESVPKTLKEIIHKEKELVGDFRVCIKRIEPIRPQTTGIAVEVEEKLNEIENRRDIENFLKGAGVPPKGIIENLKDAASPPIIDTLKDFAGENLKLKYEAITEKPISLDNLVATAIEESKDLSALMLLDLCSENARLTVDQINKALKKIGSELQVSAIPLVRIDEGEHKGRTVKVSLELKDANGKVIATAVNGEVPEKYKTLLR